MFRFARWRHHLTANARLLLHRTHSSCREYRILPHDAYITRPILLCSVRTVSVTFVFNVETAISDISVTETITETEIIDPALTETETETMLIYETEII